MRNPLARTAHVRGDKDGEFVDGTVQVAIGIDETEKKLGDGSDCYGGECAGGIEAPRVAVVKRGGVVEGGHAASFGSVIIVIIQGRRRGGILFDGFIETANAVEGWEGI